ncbi:MAG: hypothetical protein M5R36_09290 [Deltaproteobacteria bacterium]|nr:hypothetical protein [Deltaproteobacteria bacterium]
MRYAVLYNVFCCFMVTLIGAATARHILLYRDRGPADRHFAWFWIFGAALWFFAGVRLLFYHAGMLAFDRFVFYVVQIFVVLHIAPAVGHTIAKLTDHRRLNAATQLFSFLFILPFYGTRFATASWTNSLRAGAVSTPFRRIRSTRFYRPFFFASRGIRTTCCAARPPGFSDGRLGRSSARPRRRRW